MMHTAPVTAMPDDLDHSRPIKLPDSGLPVGSERTDVLVKEDRGSQVEESIISSPSRAVQISHAGLS